MIIADLQHISWLLQNYNSYHDNKKITIHFMIITKLQRPLMIITKLQRPLMIITKLQRPLMIISKYNISHEILALWCKSLNV